ncbi:DNA polymerase [Pedobacter sp. SYSU D00535]|uniref:DNA polymerase n=1 Tax=Pedobacter sp. SYSU D00535 TaxID=2810308 RepID=UPI001A95DAAA|nr:DNA polymerase [Pedobacter sp. SYSU D00535]
MKRFAIILLNNQWHGLNIDDHSESILHLPVSQDVTLVSSQTADVIRSIKSMQGIKTLPDIIDLESFDKQMSQEGKEFRADKKWKLLSFLKHYRVVGQDFKLSSATIKECLEAIAKVFLQLYEKDTEEKNRFEEIEKKINKVIYRRQLEGIKINAHIILELCKSLEREIYRAKNNLQLKYNIYNPDSIDQQRHYIEKCGYNLIKSTTFTFKARRGDDEVCKMFYEIFRNQQDLDSLLMMLSHWGGENRTNPTYHGFGTITSRITLREPGLQNLRKANRVVIEADEGYNLLYIDYCQFEAGILASISKDNNLINLYKKDIYRDLAREVIGDETKRGDAKIIFYRYIYGDNSLSEHAKAYFHRFKKLEVFRDKVYNSIHSSSRIGTTKGNYRYRKNDEYTWALSHLIQGTASLIYKQAVLRVAEDVQGADLLIPMHDGTLYQVATGSYINVKEQIEQIYKDEFKKICPEIDVLVKCDERFHV